MAKKKKDAGRKSTAAAAAERMVMGGMPQQEQDEELMQSPMRMVVGSFIRDKIAMIGLCAFIVVFLCCMILPFFFPIELNYQDVTQANVAPGFGMLKIPDGLKNNAKAISSGSTFSVGIDNDGNVYEWGTFPTEKLKNIPSSDEMGKLTMISAGLDHVVAVIDELDSKRGTIFLSRGEEEGPQHPEGNNVPDAATRPADAGAPAAAQRSADTATPEAANPPQPHEKDASSPIVQMEGVGFSYDGRSQALDDVSLVVEEGVSTAIVGQTGSGKSTLLRLLCGLETPDWGSVVVAGSDTSTRRGRRAVRSAVGYVMQHPERQLFAETVEKDVAFGPRNLRLPEDEVRRRVDKALEVVGLSTRRDASPFTLSGGQRRLCALAGILAMRPRVLVLDEPTAGLDPHGRAMLRGVLARLQAADVTIIQVTHSMEDAARSDRVVVLDQSRLIAAGDPRTVFAEKNEGLLAACGLGIPRSLRVARALEHRGWPALGDPLTTDELVEMIRRNGPLASSEVS